jgi:hypothetical protein
MPVSRVTPDGDDARRQGEEVPMFGMRRREFITLLGGALALTSIRS